jgi:hypothetical protein
LVAFSKETQTVIERGQAAWQRLLASHSDTINDWFAIGEAIEEASTAMLHSLGLNKPEGKTWAINFGDWLKETGFNKIDKAVRSRLKRCMEHRIEIQEWLASLPIEKRVDYNHPSTVWRKWNAEFGVSASVKKGPTKVEQLTAANLQLQDDLDGALKEVSRLRSEEPESWEPKGSDEVVHDVPDPEVVQVINTERSLKAIVWILEQSPASLNDLAKEMVETNPAKAATVSEKLAELIEQIAAAIDSAVAKEKKARRPRRRKPATE